MIVEFYVFFKDKACKADLSQVELVKKSPDYSIT